MMPDSITQKPEMNSHSTIGLDLSDFEGSPVAEGADASAVGFPWPTASLPVEYSAHGLAPE